jgi:hypothetical protein
MKNKNQENKDQNWKKNKIMDPMMKLKKKIEFDKRAKNQNLKSKHWVPNFKYHKTLNWRVTLKRKLNSQKNQNQK